MKDTPEGMVEELREQARDAAIDRGLLPELAQHEMLEWEAADLIEEMHGALKKIHAGDGDPKQIAAPFVDPKARMIWAGDD